MFDPKLKATQTTSTQTVFKGVINNVQLELTSQQSVEGHK